MQAIVNLFTTRRFLPLFVTQFLGAFNDNLYRTALSVLIMFHISTISASQKALYASLAITIFMLPFFLFSATAGIVADKYNKAKLIKIIKFCEMVVMSFGAIGFITSNLYLLGIVLFLTGVQSTFFGPLKYSILPDHLKDNELLAGNALIEAGTFIAIILGTVFGGLIFSDSRIFSAETVVVGLALISFIITLFIPATGVRTDAPGPSLNFIKDIFSIIRIAKNNHKVFSIILALSWFWLIGAMMMSQMLEVTKVLLTSDQAVYTIILTAFCIGVGVGSILCNMLLKGKISARLIPLSALIISIFLFDLSYSISIFPSKADGLYNIAEFTSHIIGNRIIFDFLLIALFGGIYSVPLYAIIQHDSASADRSKIIAANNIMNALFMVISSVICTVLIAKISLSVPLVFSLFSGANLLVAYYSYRVIK